MSILIKGMEMPTSCRACPLATRFFDGEDVCAMLGTYVHDRDREDDCPLVPVPTHGALMDRDDFFATCPELVDGYKRITDDLVVLQAEEGEI